LIGRGLRLGIVVTLAACASKPIASGSMEDAGGGAVEQATGGGDDDGAGALDSGAWAFFDGSPGTTGAEAGGGDAGAGVDAAPACATGQPFGAPKPVQGLNTTHLEGAPRLTPDELTVYFHSNRGTTASNDIYVATRGAKAEAFGTPAAVSGVNTTEDEFYPTLSPDLLTMYYASSPTAGGNESVYYATRTSLAGAFSGRTSVTGVNTAALEGQPFLRGDGQELWFTSQRDGGVGGRDIYRAPKTATTFGPGTDVTEIESTAAEYLPTLSYDGLTIYFASTRVATGTLGSFDIWTAHRSSLSAAFDAPVPAPELNSTTVDYPGWLSPDECRIYFASDRVVTGGYDIYVAERMP
jgi:Tol biopolymer transport system component